MTNEEKMRKFIGEIADGSPTGEFKLNGIEYVPKEYFKTQILAVLPKEKKIDYPMGHGVNEQKQFHSMGSNHRGFNTCIEIVRTTIEKL